MLSDLCEISRFRWLSKTPAKTPRGTILEIAQTDQNLHLLFRLAFKMFVLTFGRCTN